MGKLPNKETVEWDELLDKWIGSSLEEKRKIGKEYGYSRLDSLSRAMKSALNVYTKKELTSSLPKVRKEEEFLFKLLSEKINKIPKIAIKNYSVNVEGNSEEAQIVLLSDFQVGMKTKSYNSEVFKDRILQLAEKIIKLGNLRRRIHNVDELHIFLLGDLVHGERIGKQINFDEFEGPAHWQIMDILAPSMCELFINLSQYYKKIFISGIEGNHGWPAGKESAYGSNWDVISMELIKAWLSNYRNILFDIERESFYKIVDVMGHSFMLVHGDQIPMHNTLPFYGVTTKGLRWRNAIEPSEDVIIKILESYKKEKIGISEVTKKMLGLPFEFVCMGHFHSLEYITFNDVTTFMNGTLLTGDEYPLKKMGLGAKAEQWSFSVHKDRITSLDPIFLE